MNRVSSNGLESNWERNVEKSAERRLHDPFPRSCKRRIRWSDRTPLTHGGGRDAPYMIVDRSTCLMYAFNVPIWPMLASMHSGTVVPVLIVNIDDIMAILANF